MESAPRALGCNEVVTPGRALHYGDNDKDDDDDNDNDDDKDDDHARLVCSLGVFDWL